MPRYSFHCINCDTEKIDEEYVEEKQLFCEKCNMIRFHKRRIAKTNFILKGSGWYKTNFNAENT